MINIVSDNVGGWRVSLTDIIVQIGSDVSLSLGWRGVLLSSVKIRYLGICHWFVYQCLFFTLVSLLMTFILVIAHVASDIHLVCYNFNEVLQVQVATKIVYRP